MDMFEKIWKKEHYEKKICNCSCTQSYFLFESQGTSLNLFKKGRYLSYLY